jgi:hypothetical protein
MCLCREKRSEEPEVFLPASLTLQRIVDVATASSSNSSNSSAHAAGDDDAASAGSRASSGHATAGNGQTPGRTPGRAAVRSHAAVVVPSSKQALTAMRRDWGPSIADADRNASPQPTPTSSSTPQLASKGHQKGHQKEKAAAKTLPNYQQQLQLGAAAAAEPAAAAAGLVQVAAIAAHVPPLSTTVRFG